jgi:hypothetical protein
MTTHQDVMSTFFAAAPNNAEVEYWDGELSPPPTTDELIEALNQGRAWCIYSAHSGPSGWMGDPRLVSNDISRMANTGMYPVSAGHSCQSNQWGRHDDVFGEVAVTTSERGFVSYWGASNSSYWDEDDWLERGFFDSLFANDMAGNLIELNRQHSVVAASYAGLTEVTLQGGAEEYYWYMYNLNGDPSLDPYTRQPDAMALVLPEQLPPLAVDHLVVRVTGRDGRPVPGALVGISQDGTLLGAGLGDIIGVADIALAAPAAGTLLVRVTAHNHLPADASIQVGSPSVGVILLYGAISHCTGSVGIEVIDADLPATGAITVAVEARPSGSSTSLVLTATKNGRFSGTLSLGSDIAVADGDTVTVTYTDADDGSGGHNLTREQSLLVDCAAPAISGLTTTSSESSFSARFTTDEPATVELVYGLTRPPQTSLGSSSLLRQVHQVTVGDLEGCTTYLFGVRTTDVHGNTALDDNHGVCFPVRTNQVATIFSEDLSDDPGWTIDNQGSGIGWQFGVPTGGGGEYGNPDPTSGHTGTNIYGVNLDGDYPNNLANDQLQLISPVIDCRALDTVELRYWRWLGVEQPAYDSARVQVSVAGGEWLTVWQNPDSISDSSWVQEVIDITEPAAGQADVRIRWTQGQTDSSWRYCGWNLDDIEVLGSIQCQRVLRPGGRRQ